MIRKVCSPGVFRVLARMDWCLCVTRRFPVITMASMKSSPSRTGQPFPPGKIFWKPVPAWLALGLFLFLGALPTRAAEATNALEIQSVTANGKILSFQGREDVSLGT